MKLPLQGPALAILNTTDLLWGVCVRTPEKVHMDHLILEPAEDRRGHHTPLQLELQVIVSQHVGSGN